MARDEWQWIDTFPKIKLLTGEVERDRWLTRTDAETLIRCCAPHLAALVRFALTRSSVIDSGVRESIFPVNERAR